MEKQKPKLMKDEKTNLKVWKQKCSLCKIEFELIPTVDLISEDLCPKCRELKEEKKAKEKVERDLIIRIPPKYRHIETDKRDLFKECIGKSVFCYGGTGTGKTVFAISLAKYYITKREKVRYFAYSALIMELRNSFKKPYGPNEKTPWDLATDIARHDGVVILDDIGAEKLTDFVREITYFILNEREQRELLTIVTSNFSLKTIDDQIDPRISSRIAGMCKVLKFGGKDRRLES